MQILPNSQHRMVCTNYEAEIRSWREREITSRTFSIGLIIEESITQLEKGQLDDKLLYRFYYVSLFHIQKILCSCLFCRSHEIASFHRVLEGYNQESTSRCGSPIKLS